MIDAHIHLSPPNLPGVGALDPLLTTAPSERAGALRREMEQAGMTAALAMGCFAGSADDPGGVQSSLEIAQQVPGLGVAVVADPTRNDADHLRYFETQLTSRQVRAIKVYLGYVPYAADHAGYRPYYELAGRHGVPVIFHTGDTYSPRARLRLAHPLTIDDIAVDHPQIQFVLAHMGNPWLLDAAEVIYKNINVWADLSGLAVGSIAEFETEESQELLHDTAQRMRRAFLYAERPNRFVYGSDWPLVPMITYRDFIRSALPEWCHDQIFSDNARVLYRL